MFFISLGNNFVHFRLQISDTGEYTCAPQGPGLQNKTVFLEVSQVVQRYCSILYPIKLLKLLKPELNLLSFLWQQTKGKLMHWIQDKHRCYHGLKLMFQWENC